MRAERVRLAALPIDHGPFDRNADDRKEEIVSRRMRRYSAILAACLILINNERLLIASSLIPTTYVCMNTLTRKRTNTADESR